MEKNKILEFENEFEKRKQIYGYISKYPGLHYREISRKLNIPKTTLYYHLNNLKKRGLIYEQEDKTYSRYFPNGDILDFEKEFFAILRKRAFRNILYVLAFYRVCTQKEIIKHLEEDFNIKKHSTTIAFHLDKLLEMDIIICAQNGREKIYMGNYKIAHLLVDFLLKHKMRFLGDNLIWQLNRLDKHSPIWYNRAKDVLLQVFPHPYHV